jgi:hypothetical protein
MLIVWPASYQVAQLPHATDDLVQVRPNNSNQIPSKLMCSYLGPESSPKRSFLDIFVTSECTSTKTRKSVTQGRADNERDPYLTRF